MLFRDAPTKPFCDICGSEVDNYHVLEIWVEEKQCMACSECGGHKEVKKLTTIILFDLFKMLAKQYGGMTQLRQAENRIKEEQFYINVEVTELKEGSLLREPTGEFIQITTQNLLDIFDMLRKKMPGTTALAVVIASISKQDIKMTIRGEF